MVPSSVVLWYLNRPKSTNFVETMKNGFGNDHKGLRRWKDEPGLLLHSHTPPHTHTRTHTRTHARTHTCTRARTHTHTCVCEKVRHCNRLVLPTNSMPDMHQLRPYAHTHTYKHTHARTHTFMALHPRVGTDFNMLGDIRVWCVFG